MPELPLDGEADDDEDDEVLDLEPFRNFEVGAGPSVIVEDVELLEDEDWSSSGEADAVVVGCRPPVRVRVRVRDTEEVTVPLTPGSAMSVWSGWAV